MAVPYTSGNAIAAGRSICGIDGGIAYFAGRGVPDFGDFLDGAGLCYGNAIPTIIGDDDVTGLVADLPHA